MRIFQVSVKQRALRYWIELTRLLGEGGVILILCQMLNEYNVVNLLDETRKLPRNMI